MKKAEIKNQRVGRKATHQAASGGGQCRIQGNSEPVEGHGVQHLPGNVATGI